MHPQTIVNHSQSIERIQLSCDSIAIHLLQPQDLVPELLGWTINGLVCKIGRIWELGVYASTDSLSTIHKVLEESDSVFLRVTPLLSHLLQPQDLVPELLGWTINGLVCKIGRIWELGVYASTDSLSTIHKVLEESDSVFLRVTPLLSHLLQPQDLVPELLGWTINGLVCKIGRIWELGVYASTDSLSTIHKVLEESDSVFLRVTPLLSHLLQPQDLVPELLGWTINGLVCKIGRIWELGVYASTDSLSTIHKVLEESDSVFLRVTPLLSHLLQPQDLVPELLGWTINGLVCKIGRIWELGVYASTDSLSTIHKVIGRIRFCVSLCDSIAIPFVATTGFGSRVAWMNNQRSGL